MATKLYDYDAVINYCSNSTLVSDLEKIQDSLIKSYNEIKRTEENYHGKGYSSLIFHQYENMYDIIGSYGGRNTGSWQTIKNIIDTVENLKECAMEDKRRYEEELAREEAERQSHYASYFY